MVGSTKRSLFGGSASQRCPECDELITSDDINIKEGFALCPGCGELSRLSDLNTSGRSVAELLNHPPRGCCVTSDGQRLKATVSLRSVTAFLFMASFTLFWNGIVSIFVLLAIAGLYANLVGPLPNWFPAPGMEEGKPRMNDAPMDLGMTLFLCLFLTPFVTIGAFTAVAALMNLLGNVKVVIDEFDSHVTTGVGFLRWKKKFNPRAVESVELGSTPWHTDGGTNQLIEIRSSRTVKFGSLMDADRMQWLRAVLQHSLLPKKHLANLPHLNWLSRSSR